MDLMEVSQVTLVVKNRLPAQETLEMHVPSLGREEPLEEGNPLQYSCLENPHGQRKLVGYSPWGHRLGYT